MSDKDVVKIFAPPVLTFLFLGICYLWARAARRGKPLTHLQRGMILYATAFAFGMTYVILFQDNLAAYLHWKDAWIATIVLWGIVLAILAWRRRRVVRPDNATFDS
jgi:formate/nitrite transporter FocA (FNT family)